MAVRASTNDPDSPLTSQEQSTSRAAIPKGIYADLVAWGQQLPIWQNELIRRLATGDTLTSADIDELAAAAVSEAEQQSVPYQRLSLADFPTVSTSDGRVTLMSVGELQHVNALRPDQTLEFGPQLTVVFGMNAAGKSGYSRVLKRLFRARVRDEILHNLRSKDPPGRASAVLVIHPQGESMVRFAWTEGDQLPEEFARFAVVDSQCSRTYVEGDSELTVAPEGLDIPARCAAAVDAVKQELAKRAAALRPDKRALQHLENDTRTGQFVRGLSSQTSQALVDEHTAFTQDDEHTMTAVAAEIERLQRDSPETIKAQLSSQIANLDILIGHLAGFEARVCDAALSSYRAALKARDDWQAAAKATRLSLADAEAPAMTIDTDPWRQMIAAAARYVESQEADVSTLSVDERCALCRQELSEPARERLRRFAAYLESEADKHAAEAETEVRRQEIGLQECPKALDEAMTSVAGSVSEQVEANAVAIIRGVHEQANAALTAASDGQWSAVPAYQPDMLSQLVKLKEELQAKRESVGPTADFRGELAAQKAAMLDLETRRALARLKDEVESFVDKLRASQRVSTVANSLNTRNISEKAEELEARYRTAEFERRFEEELRTELQFARHLPVFRKRTSKARTLLTPVVSEQFKTIKAVDVFSEGERTAISLAAVLAEVSITDDTAGLIFDDPISSLDHNVRSNFAHRLVREAKTRQVIVFTHDLAFAADLRLEAETQHVDCCVRSLEANEWATGLVEADFPWGLRSVSDRIKGLRQMIEATEAAGKSGDYGLATRQVAEFYNRLRATWERFVEEKMFAKAVIRLEKNVRPGALDDAVVTPEIVEKMQQAYKRCSEVIEAHDHTPGAGSHSPTTAEMRTDLQLLIETNALVAAELKARKERS